MGIGELLGIGNTARVYEWGKNEVIKVFHDSRDALNEAKNAEIINRLDVRSPCFSGVIEYEGKTCLIYERMDGPTMMRQMEPTTSSVSSNAKLMAQLQYEIHNTAITYPPNIKSDLTDKIRAADELTNDEKQASIDILSQLPDGNALCHYDFHPDNIIMTSRGPIIIDWLNALVGSQEADVTRTMMMIQSHALPPNAPGWLMNRDYRLLFLSEYLEEYFRLSGIGHELLEQWMIPTLAARVNELHGEYREEIIERLRAKLRKQ